MKNMNLGLYLVLSLLALVAAAGAACAQPEPTPILAPTFTLSPSATPDLQANIAAGMEATVAASAMSTPTSVPPPTLYEKLLRLIPDTPETRSLVFLRDYARIRELFDFPLPGPGADQQAMERYSNGPWPKERPDFSAPKNYFFLTDGPTAWRSHIQRQYLGFDIRNEDQAMVAGVLQNKLEVLMGRFDPEAFDRALSACSGECTPPDTRETYEGVTF